MAFVEDILEEGTTTAALGTGIAVTIPLVMVPISTVPSSSASSSSPPPLPRLSVFGPVWEACAFQEGGKITRDQEEG